MVTPFGDHSRGYDGADCFVPSNRPCPECNGTGMVECEPRSFDDLIEEVYANLASLDATLSAMAEAAPSQNVMPIKETTP